MVEFVEILNYTYIEEGDHVFEAGKDHDTFYIVLDGVAEMLTDLLSPVISGESYLNDAA